MDISPFEAFINNLMGFSTITSGILAGGLLVTIIASLTTSDDYKGASTSDSRRAKFALLRLARIWRMIVLAALSVSLLVLAICDSLIMQQRLIDSPVSDPSLLGQMDTYATSDGSTLGIPQDPYGALSGVQIDLSDYNSGLPWLIFAWMAFGIVVTLLIVQLWAHPLQRYEQTHDVLLDTANTRISELESDLQATDEDYDKAYRRQRRKYKKLNKRYQRKVESNLELISDQIVTEQENLDLIDENLELLSDLSKAEARELELEQKLDDATAEAEEE